MCAPGVLSALVPLLLAAAPGATPPPPEDPDEIRERALFLLEGRRGPDGTIPRAARTRALAEMRELVRRGVLAPGPATRDQAQAWQPLGPAPSYDGSIPYAGRVTALALHPTDANVAYAGAAQGGVWKTTDGGLTWTPLSDGEDTLAIGSLALDPSDPNTIWAGTGEGNGSCDSYFGAGILRSTDGGATWTLLGADAFAGASVARVVVHPGDPATAWAAVGTGSGGFVCQEGTGSPGVWRTTDTGATWIHVLGPSPVGNLGDARDLEIDPSDPEVLYATIEGSGVWKTTDGGTTWAHLLDGLPPVGIGRSDVAVLPNAPSTVLATFEDALTGKTRGIYRSTNRGTTWQPLPVPDGSCQYWFVDDPCTYSGASRGFCGYAMTLDAAPDGTVWLGGVGLWSSTTEGDSWKDRCSGTMHVDQHAVAFAADGMVWVGSDGGVVRRTPGGNSVDPRNDGLAITQFYPGASLHPGGADLALGGTQDLGTLKWTGTEAWPQVDGADGGMTAIDPEEPDLRWFTSQQRLVVRRTIDGGASLANAVSGLSDAGSTRTRFIAPVAMCPDDPEVLVAGSDNVWRTENAAGAWAANSADPMVPLGKLSALAFAGAGTDCATVFAGTDVGHVWRTTTGGGVAGWSDVTGALPGRAVSDLAVDSVDPNVVVVALAGFGGPHLYRTDGALAPAPVWTAIDAGLPDVPANAVALDPGDPDVVYVGTDLGVFRSHDRGASWERWMLGHPNAAVFDLTLRASTHTLVSWTHGRGAFRLDTVCALDFDPCPEVGATLRATKSPDGVTFAWDAVECDDLAGYPVWASASPATPEWTRVDTAAKPTAFVGLAAPWSAFLVTSVDRCGLGVLP